MTIPQPQTPPSPQPSPTANTKPGGPPQPPTEAYLVEVVTTGIRAEGTQYPFSYGTFVRANSPTGALQAVLLGRRLPDAFEINHSILGARITPYTGEDEGKATWIPLYPGAVMSAVLQGVKQHRLSRKPYLVMLQSEASPHGLSVGVGPVPVYAKNALGAAMLAWGIEVAREENLSHLMDFVRVQEGEKPWTYTIKDKMTVSVDYLTRQLGVEWESA